MIFITHLHIYLWPAVITQIFNSIEKLVIPIETPTKEAKAEMEKYPVIVDRKKIVEIVLGELSI